LALSKVELLAGYLVLKAVDKLVALLGTCMVVCSEALMEMKLGIGLAGGMVQPWVYSLAAGSAGLSENGLVENLVVVMEHLTAG
jgi:hypothetical protein